MHNPHPDLPSLRHLQQWMAARILGSTSAELSDSGLGLDAWLSVPPPVHAIERLHVHIGGYPARIHDSLRETYPAVAHLVGEPAFAALAQRYAASVSLTSYNLNDAGAPMPAFLRDDALTSDLPVLPDLAALEWRVACAFHAAERPPLDPRTLSWTVDEWARAVLLFQPSVAVLASVWPLLELWTARDTPRHAIDMEPHDRPDHIAIRRAGDSVRCESVSAPEALALQLLLDGRSLTETTDRAEADGHDPGAVLTWFSRWTSAGMIVDAVLADHPSA